MATPANPYDLTQLINGANGVTFGEGALSTFGGGQPVDDNNNSDPNIGVTSTTGETIYYIPELNDGGRATYTITAATNAYAAGYVKNGYSYLPEFGTVTVKNNLTNASHTYFVEGFSQNALLLSSKAHVASYFYDGNFGEGTYVSSGATIGVLSSADLAGGPSSAAYAGMVKTTSTTGTPGQTGYTIRITGKSMGYQDATGEDHYVRYSYVNTLNMDGTHTITGPTYTGVNVVLGNNPNPPTYPLVFTNVANSATGSIAAACYAEGSRIATLHGEVAVEELVEGDEAVTASGGVRPVIWIGSRRVRPMSHPRPQELNPVRIKAGAFGEAQPVRDLVVSPGHAVFVDGVLIPAYHLVNGATIIQEDVEQVRYFHIELDAHDVLLAEGLPCESYLDDGNREVFANSPEHVALYGRLDPVDWDGACAPVLRDWDKDGAALAAVKATLHARAEAMGWRVSTELALTLTADGATLSPVHATADRAWFLVLRSAEVALASRAARPFDVVPGHMDTRRLGVAIGAVLIDGQPLDLCGEAFGEGFMAVETLGDSAWRWTDGSARLTLPAGEGLALLEVAVPMVAPAWTRPAPRLKLVQAG